MAKRIVRLDNDLEREPLRQILLGNDAFLDSPRAFLTTVAGLPRDFVYNITINRNNPVATVNEVVTKLEYFDDSLATAPHYHPLGALINALLGSVGHADQLFLQTMLQKYSLLAQNPLLFNPSLGADSLNATRSLINALPLDSRVVYANALEAIQVAGQEFQEAGYFVTAAKTLQAVCRVELATGLVLPASASQPLGTGFLVGPNLLLTNYHVLNAVEPMGLSLAEKVQKMQFRFGYMTIGDAVLDGYVYKPQAQATALVAVSPADKFDYALLRLAENIGEHSSYGYLKPNPRAILVGEEALVLQHPDGKPLKFLANKVIGSQAERVHYLTNTLPGSSGSPIFDKAWTLIGLHHSGAPYPPIPNAVPSDLGFLRGNEGIPFAAILPEIQSYLH